MILRRALLAQDHGERAHGDKGEGAVMRGLEEKNGKRVEP